MFPYHFIPIHAIASGFGRAHPGGPSLTFQDPPAAADASLVAGAYRVDKLRGRRGKRAAPPRSVNYGQRPMD